MKNIILPVIGLAFSAFGLGFFSCWLLVSYGIISFK